LLSDGHGPQEECKTLLKKLQKGHVQKIVNDLLTNGNENLVHHYISFLDKSLLLELSGFKTSEVAAKWFENRGLIKEIALKSDLEKNFSCTI
jgi:hypothetical protein